MDLTEAQRLRPGDLVVVACFCDSAPSCGHEYVVEEVFDDGLAIKAVGYEKGLHGSRFISHDYFDPSEIQPTGKRMSWIKKMFLDLFW